MRSLSAAIAIVAAAALAAVGVVYGTYAAGGSDSSCYTLLAESFASGRIAPSSPLVAEVPWPDAQKTFTPGGFVPSVLDRSSFAPVCAPGFSAVLALVSLGQTKAFFFVTPAAAVLLILSAFFAGRALSDSSAGAMAAVLTAASPPVLFQVVQPMNDITTAALWIGTFAALLHRRYFLAGISCGAALLVRPNLLPLAVLAALFVLRIDRRQLMRFAIALIPFAAAVLWLNAALYGSPFSSGYGPPRRLFGLEAIPMNAARYPRWLIETHTVFPLLAFAAPFAIEPVRRAGAWFAVAMILAISAIYFAYTPFDDWSYLRFLLPAIALMLILASAAVVTVSRRLSDKGSSTFVRRLAAPAVFLAAALGLASFQLRAARSHLAFDMHALERRYRSAGFAVRDRLPENAVVLSVWDSGAVRFHGRKEALVWEALDPAWLDRTLAWLDAHGRRPYIMVESWEEPRFRARFGDASDTGKLDWPPKFEVDRVVRIFDPLDRARYLRGDRVGTEYLWPLRK